uniref:Major facilitator superfamily (MFS) profile domain-containing protein n=1 Tax=Trichogramma kaykai TaxID=54128 RepID=A0ABD2W0Z6_9HYME
MTAGMSQIMNGKKNEAKREEEKLPSDNTQRVVFFSLLMDLLAFTMILPLFPALLDHYRSVDDGQGLYSIIQTQIQKFSTFLNAPDKVTTVLYGGFLGSLYSFLQFLGSPIVGALSDVYGRKPMMLLCLGGIALSHLLWALSSNFGIFILARVIGGISKGNVSLSMAIISDVTTQSTRQRAMALVGIAFSVGFVIGPMIGAYFAKATMLGGRQGPWYVVPALCAFLLAACDLIYVACCMKESLPAKGRVKSLSTGISGALAYINPTDLFRFSSVGNLTDTATKQLRSLGKAYFFYLFIYSGLEFTLTFLCHYTFGFSRMQQGWMFLGIGTTMALLQSCWVRRIPPNRTQFYAELGLWLVIPSYVIVALAKSIWTLCFGIFVYSVSTAMVVTCMMTLVSKIGPENQTGAITGIFRSLGALARACGPIVASIGKFAHARERESLVNRVRLPTSYNSCRDRKPVGRAEAAATAAAANDDDDDDDDDVLSRRVLAIAPRMKLV